MYERVCLVSSHEIGLKGRNRSQFERRLQSNLDAALDGLPVGRAERLSSRLAVRIDDPAQARVVAERLAMVPGVNVVSLGVRVSADMVAIREAALRVADEAAPFSSFAVDTHRANTEFPIRSPDVNSIIGDAVRMHSGARVDLTDPEVTIGLTIIHGDAYVSTSRFRGVGGLPVGTAGRLVSLLSSGIDSPVATWRMMRRGAVTVGVHFSGRPQVSAESERLVARIGRVLERTGGLGRIYVVLFGDLQREIALSAPPDLRIVLYRRLMVRVAEAIARVEGAGGLVTGESLGQVASQTLRNLAAIDEVATMPILRPLVGNDKLEIMAEARAIGTYELSTSKTEECCTLFMPRNPETHARLPAVLEAWDALPHQRMVDDALDSLEWFDYRCPAYRPPKRWPTLVGRPGPNVAEAEM